MTKSKRKENNKNTKESKHTQLVSQSQNDASSNDIDNDMTKNVVNNKNSMTDGNDTIMKDTTEPSSSMTTDNPSRSAKKELRKKEYYDDLKKKAKALRGAVRLLRQGKASEIKDEELLAAALKKKQKLYDIAQEVKKDLKRVRQDRAIAKIRRKREERKLRKGPSKYAILFAEPKAAEGLEVTIDDYQKLPPVQQRLPWFHSLFALTLPSVSEQDGGDKEKHDYITWLTETCQRIMAILHDILAVTEKKDVANNNNNNNNNNNEIGQYNSKMSSDLMEQELISELIKLKHIPVARRYIEMSLWKQVRQFLHDSMKAAEDLRYGALDLSADEKNANDDTPKVIVNANSNISTNDNRQIYRANGLETHGLESKNFKFNSFRDKYMKDILVNHDHDLDRIRNNERMNEEDVKFLRACLDSTATLYANVKCWDEDLLDAGLNKGEQT